VVPYSEWKWFSSNSYGYHLMSILGVAYPEDQLFFFLFRLGLGFELRALRLQSRHSTSWATPPVHFGYFGVGGLSNYLYRLPLNCGPPNLSLPSSWITGMRHGREAVVTFLPMENCRCWRRTQRYSEGPPLAEKTPAVLESIKMIGSRSH
jgi:hypothetical protein